MDCALDDVGADRTNGVEDVLLVGLLTGDVGGEGAGRLGPVSRPHSMGGGRFSLFAMCACQSITELFGPGSLLWHEHRASGPNQISWAHLVLASRTRFIVVHELRAGVTPAILLDLAVQYYGFTQLDRPLNVGFLNSFLGL